MLIISLILASLVGFSLNRASICSVKVAAEIVHSGKAVMLLSIVKAALWVELVVILLMWATPWQHGHYPAWVLGWTVLAGGLLFGIGAAVNGGCALSTVSRFGDGEVAMLVTLCAMLLGSLGVDLVFGPELMSRQRMVMTWPPSAVVVDAMAVLITPWAVYEIIRIWRGRAKELTALQTLFAKSYRLSTAALLIGVSNGILYFMNGSWAFTSAVDRELHHRFGLGAGGELAQWCLLTALLVGAAASALQRGRFRLDWKPSRSWLHSATGGALMGAGTAMTPRGNDALILQGVPSLSPHAVPALVSMFLGILSVLGIRRILGRANPHVRCVNDLCVEEP